MNDMSWAKQVVSPALGFCSALKWLKADPKMGGLLGFIYRPPNAKRHPTSLWGQRPKMESVWTELSYLRHLLLVSDHSIIAWKIRTINLICQIIDFQGTCDPCRYSVVLLRPQTIWMEAPSLARSWKLQEHVWERGRALVPGMSLRLEAILLASCLRVQGPKSKSLSWLCLWYMDSSIAGDHEVFEDTDRVLQDLVRLEVGWASFFGRASS